MKVLLVNQCFYPDVVSSAQHLTDLAVELSERGHEVTVIASRTGYEHSDRRFPKREIWKGINVYRIPTLGLGKKSRWRRAANFGSFLIACTMRLALLPRQDVTIGMTSPPLISFLAALYAQIKGGKFIFWVMDLNPDEAIAAGWLKEKSFAGKFLASLLGYSLRRADKVIVLDRFMQERIARKGVAEEKLLVLPPWSHDDAVRYDQQGRERFRHSHGLSDKFVVMYSGNHSPCHKLDTLLQAARQLADNKEIAFCFVGGGGEFQKVKNFIAEHGLNNVLCLPYQPLDNLAASLSAADIHVVVMGDDFKGIVHPCKIYNILAVGAPFLYIGPAESHVTDILSEYDGHSGSRSIRHGEVEKTVRLLLETTPMRSSMRPLAADALTNRFSKRVLLDKMLDAIQASSDVNPTIKLAPEKNAQSA